LPRTASGDTAARGGRRAPNWRRAIDCNAQEMNALSAKTLVPLDAFSKARAILLPAWWPQRPTFWPPAVSVTGARAALILVSRGKAWRGP